MTTIDDYLFLPDGRTLLKEHVKAADLLDYISHYLRRFVVLSVFQAAVITLWIIHTYIFDSFDTTPYLNIYSPEKRSGKTRLLEVLEFFVRNPWLTGRVTYAVLARKVDKEKPTLLLDESDTAFKGNQEYSQTLRGILNSGYRRTGRSSICVGQGANIGYRDLSTFCPKAIAGIGNLPDTISDRSIPIRLKRRSQNETIEPFRFKQVEVEASVIRQCIERWIGEINLSDCYPEIPGELDDRAADCWEPLLAIADAAGKDWPEKSRKAALELMTGLNREDESLGIRLLINIKQFLNVSSHITSASLVSSLKEMEESPWSDLNGKPLDPRKLAALLKPFDIRPRTIRDGETTLKGYHRVDFIDTWQRYLPENNPLSVTSVTPDSAQLQNEDPNYPSQTPENTPNVTDNPQSYVERNVTDVTDKTLKTKETIEKPAGWNIEI